MKKKKCLHCKKKPKEVATMILFGKKKAPVCSECITDAYAVVKGYEKEKREQKSK